MSDTGFESTLTGVVQMASIYTHFDPVTGRPLYTHLRVIAKQANGLPFEAVQIVGCGPDAITRAAVMRGRMPAGTPVEAHGNAVSIARNTEGDPPRLFLHNVEYIRTQPGRTARPGNVHSILHRLAERVPAVARGMQAGQF